MKNFSVTTKAFSLVALFVLCNSCGQSLAGAVEGENIVTDSGIAGIFDEPDTSSLEHINEGYLFSCQAPKAWEGYDVFDETLISLNQKTFNVVKELALHNKKIRKMTIDLGRQLEKVYVNVANKDIRKQKKSVLKQMDKVKDELENTRKKINENQQLVDESQKQIGDIYCRVNGYVTFYDERSEIASNNEMNDVAVYDKNTAGKMQVKRRQLFTIMTGFDNYFGYLNELFQHCEHKVALLDSVQRNIVAYIDGICRDKNKPCVYKMEADLRFQEAQLQKLLADIEVAFAELVATAKDNFSENFQGGLRNVSAEPTDENNSL
jgi:hypothetical protein